MTPEQRRHILEMCAKACGYKYSDLQFSGETGLCLVGEFKAACWDPLADTEAGRSQCVTMCAELGINTTVYGSYLECWEHGYKRHCDGYFDNHPTKTAAWQAAACAVAAKIGEAM